MNSFRAFHRRQTTRSEHPRPGALGPEASPEVGIPSQVRSGHGVLSAGQRSAPETNPKQASARGAANPGMALKVVVSEVVFARQVTPEAALSNCRDTREKEEAFPRHAHSSSSLV